MIKLRRTLCTGRTITRNELLYARQFKLSFETVMLTYYDYVGKV